MNFRFAENDDLAAVVRLNDRLKAGGSQESMTLEPRLRGEGRYTPEPIYRRMMIAEDGQEVRAALLLCHHNIFIHGERRDFGDLKVGTLVDGIGRSADVPALVAVGLNHLVEMGVDLIVANFSHSAWVRGCRRSGMFGGPSNYQIFVSPQGGPLLEETCPLHLIHVSRGHGDGMDHLI